MRSRILLSVRMSVCAAEYYCLNTTILCVPDYYGQIHSPGPSFRRRVIYTAHIVQTVPRSIHLPVALRLRKIETIATLEHTP